MKATKATWSGSISFGLVTIPVKLYKATDDKSLRFNLLHDACKARIKQKRTCSACSQEVAGEDIVKGYEVEPDTYVVLTEAELDRGAPASRAISITQFVDATEVDPVCFDAAYYLGPEAVGVRAYRLLVEAMRRTGRVAVAMITMRERERPVLLRLVGEVIALETMFWPDEVRTPAFDLDAAADLKPQELDMACALIEGLAAPFDANALRDDYRERLEALIAAKREGTELPAADDVESPKVLDLVEALRASVQATKPTPVTEQQAAS